MATIDLLAKLEGRTVKALHLSADASVLYFDLGPKNWGAGAYVRYLQLSTDAD